jgi:hypothetical protein
MGNHINLQSTTRLRISRWIILSPTQTQTQNIKYAVVEIRANHIKLQSTTHWNGTLQNLSLLLNIRRIIRDTLKTTHTLYTSPFGHYQHDTYFVRTNDNSQEELCFIPPNIIHPKHCKCIDYL